MKAFTNPKKQKGAVLAVSLMLLLVVSLIAISSMESSVTQERMSRNFQNNNRAFQTASSAIDNHITNTITNGDTTQLSQAIIESNKTTPSWPTQTYTSTGSTNITTNLSIIFEQEVPALDNSINADESSPTLMEPRLRYVATSTIANTGATIEVVQGIAIR